jgi:hypothetical protein
MCGRLDVDRLMSEIPATLFNEWWGFYSIEPEPAQRITDHIIKLICVVAAGLGLKLNDNDLYIRYGETENERIERKMRAFNRKMSQQTPTRK